MAIRYLRRPPKPAAARARAVNRAVAAHEARPEEQALVAQPLANFCARCGQEHPTPEASGADGCSAESKLQAVDRHAPA